MDEELLKVSKEAKVVGESCLMLYYGKNEYLEIPKYSFKIRRGVAQEVTPEVWAWFSDKKRTLEVCRIESIDNDKILKFKRPKEDKKE